MKNSAKHKNKHRCLWLSWKVSAWKLYAENIFPHSEQRACNKCLSRKSHHHNCNDCGALSNYTFHLRFKFCEPPNANRSVQWSSSDVTFFSTKLNAEEPLVETSQVTAMTRLVEDLFTNSFGASICWTFTRESRHQPRMMRCLLKKERMFKVNN